jgi:hypothetical protein
MGAKFYASYPGIGELLSSTVMEKEMVRRARLIQQRAAETAPVGDPVRDPHPGRYRDSFRIESGRDGGFKKDRAYGRVINDAPEAFYVEYGSSKIEARHTLLNAAQAAKE